MIDNKIKNALAKANNLDTERRIEMIREGVREELPNSADEFAILRKAIANIDKFLMMQFPYAELNQEFEEYNAKVEAIKADAKAQLEDN